MKKSVKSSIIHRGALLMNSGKTLSSPAALPLDSLFIACCTSKQKSQFTTGFSGTSISWISSSEYNDGKMFSFWKCSNIGFNSDFTFVFRPIENFNRAQNSLGLFVRSLNRSLLNLLKYDTRFFWRSTLYRFRALFLIPTSFVFLQTFL